jgi:hypothetical protein
MFFLTTCQLLTWKSERKCLLFLVCFIILPLTKPTAEGHQLQLQPTIGSQVLKCIRLLGTTLWFSDLAGLESGHF